MFVTIRSHNPMIDGVKMILITATVTRDGARRSFTGGLFPMDPPADQTLRRLEQREGEFWLTEAEAIMTCTEIERLLRDKSISIERSFGGFILSVTPTTDEDPDSIEFVDAILAERDGAKMVLESALQELEWIDKTTEGQDPKTSDLLQSARKRLEIMDRAMKARAGLQVATDCYRAAEQRELDKAIQAKMNGNSAYYDNYIKRYHRRIERLSKEIIEGTF